MKLKYITCSDPQENISVPSILNFAERYPMVELGIQAQPGPMSYDGRRNAWFKQIVYVCSQMSIQPNIALHINYEWCDCMCHDVIPLEIAEFIQARNKLTGEPVIKRIQLNIGDRTNIFNPDALAKLIKRQKDQEFILPYNEKVAPLIKQLKPTGAKFLLLFDTSYGAGIEPESWQPPVYKDIPTGYAGGSGRRPRCPAGSGIRRCRLPRLRGAI